MYVCTYVPYTAPQWWPESHGRPFESAPPPLCVWPKKEKNRCSSQLCRGLRHPMYNVYMYVCVSICAHACMHDIHILSIIFQLIHHCQDQKSLAPSLQLKLNLLSISSQHISSCKFGCLLNFVINFSKLFCSLMFIVLFFKLFLSLV